jgi:thymidine kinase
MRAVAELIFYAGTMDCGKSTLALQTDYNHASRGRVGITFTRLDRLGQAVVSSRLGLQVPAVEVREDLDLRRFIVDRISQGSAVDYAIADEAQFYTPVQVEQLASVVDDLHIDVYAFGILTDFRTRLFPGSARLVELADRVVTLQVEALCWCGSRATHNARVLNGTMVVSGDQVVVGDTNDASGVGYEVLCRRHYMSRITSARARTEHMSRAPLPFEQDN